jgi:uncharacterized membrane protein
MNAEHFATFFQGLPPEIVTFIVGMTPIFELRGAIPLAITFFKLGTVVSFFWAVAGNISVMLLLAFLLRWGVDFISKHFTWGERFFEWLFERTRKRAHKHIEKYGDWGLFFLVAIPLPMTGGWTGGLAAFLFDIEKKKSVPIISAGIMTAGVIVTLLTLGATKAL